MPTRRRKTVPQLLRSARRAALRVPDVALRSMGATQPESRLIADAESYWADTADPQWRDNAHWSGSDAIDRERFLAIGAEHLALFDRLAGSAGGRDRLGRVVDWGAGGGANAVAFAPRADEYVAVDLVAASTAECRRQVEAVCTTPVTEVVSTVAHPEAALAALPGPADLFVCLYVLELVPSPEYGIRLMDLARRALRPGGLAFVQIKYDRGDLASRPRRRDYRLNSADMTTYRLDDFWVRVQATGLTPLAMTLVPENDLDRRYAYLLLQAGSG